MEINFYDLRIRIESNHASRPGRKTAHGYKATYYSVIQNLEGAIEVLTEAFFADFPERRGTCIISQLVEKVPGIGYSCQGVTMDISEKEYRKLLKKYHDYFQW